MAKTKTKTKKASNAIYFALCLTLALALTLTLAVSAVNAKEITSSTVINQSGVYYIANNITTNKTCIKIEASNVILEGNGYTITGKGEGYGIYADNVDNITVKDLTLKNLKYGIYFEVNKGEIKNVKVENSAIDGIYINGSNSIILKDVTSNNNKGTGIVVNACTNVTVKDATANNNIGSGTILRAGTKNTILRNVTVSGDYYGVWLKNTKDNTLKDINANHNLHGLYLENASSNVLEKVNVENSSSDGIFLITSSNNPERHNLPKQRRHRSRSLHVRKHNSRKYNSKQQWREWCTA